jgi:putative CocE/NonD family hydrolase
MTACPFTSSVRVRDSIQLATDVFLPKGEGPFPVILERTPYGRHMTSRSERTVENATAATRAELAAYFGDHGYAVVYQDCRGRYGSEGRFSKYLLEGSDGFDTCEWLLKQPWCDGRILTMGLSYAAHTQAALGCLDAPGIVAQVMDSGGFADAWRGGIRSFGAFELKQVTWAHQQAILSPEAQADPVMKAALEAEDMREWFLRLPWKQGHSPLRHHPDYEAYVFEQWRHGAFDEYWKQVGIWAAGFYDRYCDADTVHLGSWFDVYPLGTVTNYIGLKKAGRGPQRLIMGPWTHGDRSITQFGEVDFGADATIDSWAGDWKSYRLRFFDTVTKKAPDNEPPVRLFMMGGGSGGKTAEGRLHHGGRWVSLSDFPAPETKFVDYHFHEGVLSPAAPQTGAEPLSFDFDPSNPVPTLGHGLTRETTVKGGVFDQVETADLLGAKPPYLPLSARSDVLVFQTETLSQPTQIVGPLVATLWVETNGPDTDFTAKLIDVYPASESYPRGYAMILADGIMRLRYNEDPARPRMRKPGEVTKIQIVLAPTANLFAPGHRIRVDVSSSNFPKYDVNPNTGEPEGNSRRKRVAINTVYVDAARPSHITLPILPLT